MTTFSYDDASRLVQMVDSTGTTTWAYNAADQVVTLAQPAGTITYEYDDNARLWKMHQPGSLTTTYTYDFAWRLKQITNGYGEITTFDYDPASRVIKKSFANGTYETYSYDSRSRVEWIKLFNSSNQLLSQHQYTYDASSNVLTRTDNGGTTTFGYDDLGQLISESRPGYSASYTYDKNGNRLTRTLNGVTEVYTYDDADKLLNIKVSGIVVKSFTYDMAGRTTGITDSGGTTTLSYDYEDRLVSISRPGVATNTFAYNGFGARVSKTDSSGSNTYLRASSGLIGSIVADSGATYTPGVSEKRGATSTFYHSDIKNSVEQTSTSQTVSASKQYDAFGNEVSSSGPWQGPFQYGGAFGYHTDSDYGLKHLGARYYDPTTGRFLSRDPIKDGRNWYGYCFANPVGRTDPTGLVAPVVVYGAVILVGALIGGVAGYFSAPEGEKVAGVGRGLLYGAVGTALSLLAVPVAAYLMGVGIPGWVAGSIGGAVGGFASGVGVETTGVVTGWDEDFDWWRVGASTAVGAIAGGIVLRPGNAATQAVTHYGTPGGGIPQGAWVQVGKPGVLARALSGKVSGGSPNTATVPGDSLVYPPGWEYIKGWIGQRKYMGPDILPATRWGGGSLRY